MTRTTYHVRGTLAGANWWPFGERATKSFTYHSVERPDSLRDLAEAIMGAEDDAPRFLADSVLTITRYRADGHGHRSRSFYLADLPSLADYVAADELPAYALEVWATSLVPTP